MDLSKITTADLIREIESRSNQEKEDELVYPHVFMYSHNDNEFESKLVPIKTIDEMQTINSMQLRARFNAHRSIEIYAIKMSIESGNSINETIFNDSDEEIFEDLKSENLLVSVGW